MLTSLAFAVNILSISVQDECSKFIQNDLQNWYFEANLVSNVKSDKLQVLDVLEPIFEQNLAQFFRIISSFSALGLISRRTPLSWVVVTRCRQDRRLNAFDSCLSWTCHLRRCAIIRMFCEWISIYYVFEITQRKRHVIQLLRSEISSGMCAKLRTVAASNNRDPARNLSACSRYLYNGVILHAHPVRGESHINATPPERLQQLLSRLNLEIFTLHHCAINCWRQK